MSDKFNFRRRRKLIKTSLGGSSLLLADALSWNKLVGSVYADTPDRDPFFRPFKFPALDTGARSGNTVKFKLKIQNGSSNFLASATTKTLGINCDYLGPVLRVRKGDQVQFCVTNTLGEQTTLHWHGLMLPAKMDGGPHQLINPGETWKPEFKIIQPASSYWYHAHTHQRTGHQVYHGLAGLFIVDDEISESLKLPNEYGVDDLPVIIQDRSFNRDGSFRYISSMHDRMRGMLGNKILVNGVITPTLKAVKSQIRMRLLNGSNARIYDLSFHDGRPFSLIAGDGGFLDKSITVNTLRLAPGERAEILLDLSDGKDAVLQNQPVANKSSGGMMGIMMGGGDERFNIMKISAPHARNIKPAFIESVLAPLPNWGRERPSQLRKFQLEMAMGPRMMMQRMAGRSPFSINGEAFDMGVINFRAKKSSYEIWIVGNDSMLAHPFHIHNTQFLVLARSDRPVAANEHCLKDTVIVYPQQRVRLLVCFPEYADANTPYMYHCHILEHEDGGMMGQFTVES